MNKTNKKTEFCAFRENLLEARNSLHSLTWNSRESHPEETYLELSKDVSQIYRKKSAKNWDGKEGRPWN